jgi:type IV pilus assembly protein PilW
MTMQSSYQPRPRRSTAHGLSLVELLVALALGLVLVVGVATVYLFTKTAFNRQAQLSTLQQSVRTAFEYLGNDARMVGHLGCFTNSSIPLPSDLSAANMRTNYQVGIEGFDYNNGAAGTYPMTSDNPANETDAAKWRVNAQGTGTKTVPLADLGGGLTPGSDVLVIRTVVGQPIRLRADTTTAGASPLKIEAVAGGTCIGSGAAKVSGFCTGSHGLLANCTTARAFSVNSIAGADITPVDAGKVYPVFPSGTAEVFPLQTIVYYVKRSINHPGTTSLYRTIFNGDPAGGTEQELIEDIESLQVQYGEDTSAPDRDGTVDRYIRAHEVTAPDWANIVTVRMSLLLRSATPVQADLAGALAASAAVNGVAITYPTGSRYDRRVFTTTVAIRNRIAYF